MPLNFKFMRSSLLMFIVAIVLLVSYTEAQTEPLGGQPERGDKQSVKNLDEQVAYERSFEAISWAMPASAIYRFRLGLLELPGVTDNVIAATSRPISPI